MRSVLQLVIVSVLLLAPTLASAQDRARLDIVPGISFATGKLAGSDLSVGPGAEFGLSARVMPHLFAYGAWDWRHFEASTLVPGGDVDVEETGYAFGVRFEHPFRDARSPALMVRLGGTYTHLEIENTDGDLLADSEHGFGWEAGAGVVFGLGERWHVTPAARFRSLARDLKLPAISTGDATLRHVALEIGFSRSF